MLVQVNTDNHVTGDDELASRVSADLERTLQRFVKQITRIEVHLNDANADKSGPNDKRCVLEARIAGRDPIAATHDAPTINEAVKGATDKLARVLDRTIAKLRHPKGRDPYQNEVFPERT
jgi:ribosome-associated translation inhibitor RaiA